MHKLLSFVTKRQFSCLKKLHEYIRYKFWEILQVNKLIGKAVIMAPGYGISSIGNYANDPYFMYAYNGYNPNFMGVQQYPQAAQSVSDVQVPDTTVVTDPAFKGSDKSEGSSSNTALLVGGTAVSAAALIYAAKKGNGKGIKEGFKNIYNSWFKKGAEKAADKIDDAAAKISNIIKGKGLNECQVKNGTDLITIKNGGVSNIITKAEKKVKNVAGVRLPSGVSATSKDVTFSSIERTIKHKGKDYKVVLDKEGNIIEAFVKNKKVNIDDLDKDITEKAQTFTDTLKGKKIQLIEHGRFVEHTGKDITLMVKNGELLDATYLFKGKTTHLNNDELAKLAEDYADEIGKFGRRKGFGLKPEECIYEYSNANRRFIFDSNGKVKEAFDVTTNTIKKPQEVAKYLEKHGMTDVAKTGNIPSGATIANATYTTDAGNVFTIKNGKIESVKIKEACTVKTRKNRYNFSAGRTITGNELNVWQNAEAANNNDFKAILEMLK